MIKRVAKETNGLFKDLFPISLTQALASANDPEGFEASGAGPLTSELDALIESIAEYKEATAAAEEEARRPVEPVAPTRIRPKKLAAREGVRTRPQPGSLEAGTLRL